MHCNVGVFIMT